MIIVNNSRVHKQDQCSPHWSHLNAVGASKFSWSSSLHPGNLESTNSFNCLPENRANNNFSDIEISMYDLIGTISNCHNPHLENCSTDA